MSEMECEDKVKPDNVSTVYILLLNWNGWQDTLECLRSLEDLDYPNYRVLVVDNGSTDDSVARIREAYPNVVLVETGGNLGFSAGNNVGIRYALERAADYVWLLNNDTKVMDRDVLKELVTTTGVDAIGTTVTAYCDKEGIWYSGGKVSLLLGGPVHSNRRTSLDKRVYETKFISGCNMFIPRKLIDKLGLLDERFFLGQEDAVYSLRALRNGYRLKVLNRISICHKVGVTNTPSAFSLANSYLCRSFWVNQVANNSFLFWCWFLLFAAINVLFRKPILLFWNRLRKKTNPYSIITYLRLAFVALLRGRRINKITEEDVKVILQKAGVAR